MSVPDWRIEGRGWPNAEASRFVEARGLRWHVQVAGPVGNDVPVVLLLHGTGAATHSWREMLPLLAERTRVIAPDLPGHGFTRPPRDGDYSLPGMARLIAALLAELGESPALIVGHSAGAALAVRMALDGLARPGAIVSLNGALLPFPGLARAIFPALARLLFVNPLTPRLFALQARLQPDAARRLLAGTGSTIDARGLALYANLFGHSGHAAGALAMMASWDLEPLAADLPRLTTRLVLAYGERDRAVPPDVARQVGKRAPNATLHALPGLGHLAHEERPDLCARLILDTLVA